MISASNSAASTQAHSPAAGVGAGGSYTHNYSSLNSSGRQTPSALSVASLNDAALQRLHHHHQQQQQELHLERLQHEYALQHHQQQQHFETLMQENTTGNSFRRKCFLIIKIDNK